MKIMRFQNAFEMLTFIIKFLHSQNKCVLFLIVCNNAYKKEVFITWNVLSQSLELLLIVKMLFIRNFEKKNVNYKNNFSIKTIIFFLIVLGFVNAEY